MFFTRYPVLFKYTNSIVLIILRARPLRSLCHWLLEPLRFLGTFGFCKIYLKSWYLRLETKKKSCALFVNVFSCTFLSWNFFNKYDSSNYIIVFIHVKKSCRTLQCQMCWTYFKKNWRITKQLQKKHEHFFSVQSKISIFQTSFNKSKSS